MAVQYPAYQPVKSILDYYDPAKAAESQRQQIVDVSTIQKQIQQQQGLKQFQAMAPKYVDQYGQVNMAAVTQSPEWSSFAEKHPELAQNIMSGAGMFGTAKLPNLTTEGVLTPELTDKFIKQFPEQAAQIEQARGKYVLMETTPRGQLVKFEQKKAPEISEATTEMKNFEAQHPEWAGKRGTKEYGDALSRWTIEHPAAKTFETTKEKMGAEKQMFLEDMPALLQLMSEGKIAPMRTSFRPQYMGYMATAVRNWNRDHKNDPQHQINPVMMEALQTGNKAALRRLESQYALIAANADSAEKHINSLGKLMEGLSDTEIQYANQMLRKGAANIGNVPAAKYFAAINEIVNEYAKVITGATGAAGITDAARKQAMEMLPEGMTRAQFAGIADTMKQFIKIKVQSQRDMIDNIVAGAGTTTVSQAEVTRETPTPTPAPAPAPAPKPAGGISVDDFNKMK